MWKKEPYIQAKNKVEIILIFSRNYLIRISVFATLFQIVGSPIRRSLSRIFAPVQESGDSPRIFDSYNKNMMLGIYFHYRQMG
jgi:hypothetical protein